jgi:prolyl 4-hydroxylase
MIKILDSILTKEECSELIKIGSDSMKQATTLGKVVDGYRTADNSWIYDTTELTQKIKNLVAKESALPVENQEEIHIVRYNIGGQYKAHHDFFHPNESYYETSTGKAGQRTFSFLFYLNHNFTGGETEFTHKKIKIIPKTGRLLIWRNMNEDGTLDYDSMHAGLPVLSGTKYIAIIWVRENKFKQ